MKLVQQRIQLGQTQCEVGSILEMIDPMKGNERISKIKEKVINIMFIFVLVLEGFVRCKSSGWPESLRRSFCLVLDWQLLQLIFFWSYSSLKCL